MQGEVTELSTALWYLLSSQDGEDAEAPDAQDCPNTSTLVLITLNRLLNSEFLRSAVYRATEPVVQVCKRAVCESSSSKLSQNPRSQAIHPTHISSERSRCRWKSIMAVPILLTGLTLREAIHDTIYRCVNAFDAADSSLLESTFTEDSTFDLNGTVSSGLAAIKVEVFDKVASMDTTHFVTNIRISVQEADTKAQATASVLAQHYRPGEGLKPGTAQLLAGSTYELDLVKEEGEEGLWKISVFKLKTIWSEGHYGVFDKASWNV